ncbi:CpsB/CapC family capsule biosynthesis tyrosine phosphatase [Bacillus sp. CGMCC 1.16541]|uniref:tyrosine-protein phosphatase n=1 Tax=Bacillus sp. CGMCC 1.16541 TaxID=2185143 RepID=UPI000D738B6C|nr:CpsB/CapC family capsule biosynthesis tyrosine phosphatase [Bacillus sp. CGMCC 1.16541]
MIDLHCHILPGLDDGAQTKEDALEMAKQAVAQGIHTIIATPHHQNRQYQNEKNVIIERVKELNDYFSQHNLPITILPGQEPRIYGELVDDYKADHILSLNNTGKYVFIEFPSSQVPRYTDQLIYDLQSHHLTPIIVHPERNSQLMEAPDLLYRFVQKGALTQITASSVTGQFGKKIQKFTHQLIDANLTHFVASDAHNVTSRGFSMEAAFQEIEKQYGIDYVYMFHENAASVVDGKTCFIESPQPIKRKKFLGIF